MKAPCGGLINRNHQSPPFTMPQSNNASSGTAAAANAASRSTRPSSNLVSSVELAGKTSDSSLDSPTAASSPQHRPSTPLPPPPLPSLEVIGTPRTPLTSRTTAVAAVAAVAAAAPVTPPQLTPRTPKRALVAESSSTPLSNHIQNTPPSAHSLRSASAGGSIHSSGSPRSGHCKRLSRKQLRRMSISDPVEESTADQRLVDYFLVVSSKRKAEAVIAPASSSSSSLSLQQSSLPEQQQQQQQQQKTPNTNKNAGTTGTSTPKSARRTLWRRGDSVRKTHAVESRQDEHSSASQPPSMPDLSGDAADTPAAAKAQQPQQQQQQQQQQPHYETPTYSPKITTRYPAADYADNPLNAMIPQFCFPTQQHDVIKPVSTYELPRVHYFVLTNEKGRKVYGTCLTILEEVPEPPEPQSHQKKKQQRRHSSSSPQSSIHTTVLEELSSIAYNLAGVEVTSDVSSGNSSNGIQKRPKNRTLKTLYVPKVLCLLSSWPYLTAFREYLAQLYRLATMTNVMTAPIERFLANICCEIPAPPPGAYEIQVNILDSTIRFWAPPGKLPLAYVALPYQVLFECLDIENILHVWSALITERKVLLLSSQFSILTICCEILCSLLFPLRWSHLYIPLLPRSMCAVLDAPVPYLCGLVRECWSHAEEHISPETIVVDLDRNTVSFGSETPRIPDVPSKKYNKLLASLQQTVGHLHWKSHGLEQSYEAMMTLKPKNRSMRQLRQEQEGQGRQQWMEKLEGLDRAFNLAYTPDSKLVEDYYNNNGDDDATTRELQTPWDKVQEAFLRFFVAIFKDYRRYLVIPPSSSPKTESSDTRNPYDPSSNGSPNRPQPSFDVVAFLAAQPSHSAAFLNEVCMSQQFDSFITRRMYSPGEPDLIFFDQSIDAKLNRSKLKLNKVETPFLQSVQSHKVLTKMKAVEPNEVGLPDNGGKPYVYEAWPETLNESLFRTPRPIPKMIAAEFDRQAILVSRLRAHGAELDDAFVDFDGAEYDPSPEVAVFTVFFFAYSALVGLQWQEYEKKLQEAEKKRKERSQNVKEQDNVSGEDERDLPSQGPENESYGESMNFCTPDFSLGDVCGICPQESLTAVKSTLSFVGEGAEDVYTTLMRETADKFMEIQRQLTSGPESQSQDSAAAENATEEYEEAREVAMAQLDLAFESLGTLELRGLPADLDAYKSLMEACGRCGDTQRALKLMECMKKDGFAADSQLLSCFISSFAHDEIEFDGGHDSQTSSTPTLLDGDRKEAYASLLKKEFGYLREQEERAGPASDRNETSFVGKKAGGTTECLDETRSESTMTSHESCQTGDGAASGILDWFGSRDSKSVSFRKKRLGKRKSKVKCIGNALQGRRATRRLSTQFDLGEALLDFLYPDLTIDSSSETCPHCSHVLSENDVVLGWEPCAFQEYKTKCPKCQHAFVPHFSVNCSSPEFHGSQGPGSALFCEFLSPWVVRKSLQHVIKGETGIEGMLDPQWRNGTDIRATLFWNLIVLFRRYNLPFGFLLQGSIQGRLILPRTPNDM